MFVIVTYDINVKRVSKIMKTCRKYLQHEQKSVFEGLLTDAQLSKLKWELLNKIDTNEDRICIYEFGSLKYTRKELLGIHEEHDNFI